MIILLIISEKSWMFLTICVYDSSVDKFWEKLNVSIQFSLKLSIELSYTQIVRNFQLFSDIISRNIIYTKSRTFNSSQNLSTERRVECFWRFVYTRVAFIISEKSWMFLTIFVYDNSVDNFWEELNVLDQLNYHIHQSSRTFYSSLIL
jgi:hypothetical protein